MWLQGCFTGWVLLPLLYHFLPLPCGEGGQAEPCIRDGVSSLVGGDNEAGIILLNVKG